MKETKILYLKVKDIKKSRASFRLASDPYEIQNLAQSIKALGIINPLIVRINENSEYEIISGNRRLEAAVLAGLSVVPCMVKKSDKLSSLILAICENTTAKRFNFFEEAEALYSLLKEHKLSVNEAALKVGISPSAFGFKTSLLRLNSILRNRIIEENLSEDFARLLLSVDEDKRETFLEEIITKKPTLAAAKLKAQKLISPPEKRYEKTVIADKKLFSNSLFKMVDRMNLSGIKVLSETRETTDSIEYIVTIPK